MAVDPSFHHPLMLSITRLFGPTSFQQERTKPRKTHKTASSYNIAQGTILGPCGFSGDPQNEFRFSSWLPFYHMGFWRQEAPDFSVQKKMELPPRPGARAQRDHPADPALQQARGGFHLQNPTRGLSVARRCGGSCANWFGLR